MSEALRQQIIRYDEALRSPQLRRYNNWSDQFIPGIAQTQDYRQAVVAAIGRVNGDSPEPDLQERRHDWLDTMNQAGVHIESYTHESALARQFGSSGNMRAALLHFADVATQADSFRIVPNRSELHNQIANIDGPSIITWHATEQRPDQFVTTVWAADASWIATPGTPEYERTVQFHVALGAVALAPDESIDMINHYADTWR